MLHGLLRIEGTRISVLHLYDMTVSGAEPPEVADALDIELSRVYEAFSDYYDHPDEIREIRTEEESALEDLKRRATDSSVEQPNSR